MRTIQTLQTAGPDKMLRLAIPVDEADCRYQVTIVVAPERTENESSTREELRDERKQDQDDWPRDFLERIVGRWEGELEREPQGEYEEREEL
ncbi:MAG TPA: hypothetical protein VMV69_12775 [Pirellulales bacterium]|nr:hypothetical protein [Pirellulales bacterium]